MKDTTSFIRKEQAQAVAYNLFTALLCQPTEEMVSGTDLFEKMKSSFQIINPDLNPDVEQMQEALKKHTQLDLLVEYTRLFIGPFGTLAPPYSSLYFGRKTLMSEETLWVINFYEEMGLSFNAELKDAPDHVAVETEFLYYLIFNEIKALEEGQMDRAHELWKGRTEFFIKHYLQWIPKFCDKITEQTNNDFYKALAVCFSKFVKSTAVPMFPKE